MTMQWRDVLPHIGYPDGPDTTAGLSDRDIARALVAEPIPLSAAMLLSERHGRIITAADVRQCIADSTLLRRTQQLGELAAEHRMLARFRAKPGPQSDESE